MNFVAAIFAAATKNQSEAYERFHAFVQDMRGLWLPGFPLLAVGTARFESIAWECGWYQHLKANGIETSMFLPQAMMTILAMWLPMPTIAQCLKLPERYGLDGIVAMTFCVLDLAKERLLQQQNMEGLLQVLQTLHDSAPQPCMLENSVHKLLQSLWQIRNFTTDLLLQKQ